MSNVKFRKSSTLTNKEKEKLMKAELDKQINDLVPAVYASIALALNKHWGFGFERINRLFQQSQEIWEELGDEEMIKLCEKETGILLKGE